MITVVKYKLNWLPVTFLSLIISIVIGFYSTLDNSTQWGCVVSDYVFSFHNISFSAFSILLVSLGYFFSNHQYGKLFILAEIVFWIHKLFFIKGGYVVGIGGITPVDILVYDFAACLLRLFLLKQVLNLPLRFFALVLIALFSIIVKVQFFT